MIRTSKLGISVLGACALAFSLLNSSHADVIYFTENDPTGQSSFINNANSRWRTGLLGTDPLPDFGTGNLTAAHTYVVDSTLDTANRNLRVNANGSFVSTLTLKRTTSINSILNINSTSSNVTATLNQGDGLILEGGFVQFNGSFAGGLAGKLRLDVSPSLLSNIIQHNHTSGTTASNISADITGLGGVLITRGGTGTTHVDSSVMFSGNNSYSGNTRIGTTNNAMLRVNSATAIPYGAGKGNLEFATPASTGHRFDLNNINTNINGLDSVSAANRVIGRFLSSGGTPTLTLGHGNADGNYAGSIENGSAAALSLAKVGSGTQVLSGNNAFTGTATINAGVLEIAGASSLNAANAIAINGGTLRYNSSTAMSNANLTFAGGSLGGIGDIAVELTIGTGATISPGNSPGTQN